MEVQLLGEGSRTEAVPPVLPDGLRVRVGALGPEGGESVTVRSIIDGFPDVLQEARRRGEDARETLQRRVSVSEPTEGLPFLSAQAVSFFKLFLCYSVY